MSTISVILMVKDEKNSIKITIDSVKNYIKNIIVLDTGSSDNTIEIIRKTCKKNNQQLYLKETKFISFPESRNEAIEFAEQVSDSRFFLLMDAGDELKTNLSKDNFNNNISSIPSKYNYGLVRHNWFVRNSLEDHYDVRFIRNKNKCRYDLRYLVHEKFKDVTDDITNLSEIFYLYQNRDLYGTSTEKRYIKDVELLSNSIPNKRNLYYLGQTYLNMEDFENGYKYNLLSYEKEKDDEEMGDHIIKTTLIRIGFCAIRCDKDKEIIFKYLSKAIEFTEPPIEAFIFLFSYAIENKITKEVSHYVPKLFYLEKPKDISNVNHEYYDYKRWSLISIVCLLSNEQLPLGKQACAKALKFSNNPTDRNNMQIYNYHL
jgi:glycosyltransferase involved in cell wall biosynthesis